MVPDEKDDPYIAALIFIVLGLCAGLFVGWLFLSSWPPADVTLRASVGVCNGLLVLGGIGTLVSWLRWRQVNRRRQAAAKGVPGVVPLAVVQPFPDEAALALPCVIIHKNKGFHDIALMIGLFIGFNMLINLIDAFLIQGAGWARFVANMQANGLFPILAFVFCYLVPRWYSNETRLVIHTDGLTLFTFHSEKRIGWNDARLFAVCGPRTLFSKAVTYELASARVVITWTLLRREQWWNPKRPVVPFEEYQRQMESLLSLIAARTHLPLYDVRQDVVG